MTRLNALLLVALLLSSMYLVRVSHESRKLFADLDKARSEQRALGVDFERLQTEKQSQATPLRIEETQLPQPCSPESTASLAPLKLDSASAMSVNLVTLTTGPKISSWKIRILLCPSKIVGWT